MMTGGKKAMERFLKDKQSMVSKREHIVRVSEQIVRILVTRHEKVVVCRHHEA